MNIMLCTISNPFIAKQTRCSKYRAFNQMIEEKISFYLTQLFQKDL